MDNKYFLTDTNGYNFQELYLNGPFIYLDNLGRSASIAWYQYPAILILMTLFGNSIKQGADSIVFCAASNRVQHLRERWLGILSFNLNFSNASGNRPVTGQDHGFLSQPFFKFS